MQVYAHALPFVRMPVRACVHVFMRTRENKTECACAHPPMLTLFVTSLFWFLLAALVTLCCPYNRSGYPACQNALLATNRYLLIILCS